MFVVPDPDRHSYVLILTAARTFGPYYLGFAVYYHVQTAKKP